MNQKKNLVDANALFDCGTRWRTATKAGHADAADQELKRLIELWLPCLEAMAYLDFAEYHDKKALIQASVNRVGRWLGAWDGKIKLFNFLSVCSKGAMLQEIAREHRVHTRIV